MFFYISSSHLISLPSSQPIFITSCGVEYLEQNGCFFRNKRKTSKLDADIAVEACMAPLFERCQLSRRCYHARYSISAKKDTDIVEVLKCHLCWSKHDALVIDSWMLTELAALMHAQGHLTLVTSACVTGRTKHFHPSVLVISSLILCIWTLHHLILSGPVTDALIRNRTLLYCSETSRWPCF